MSNDSGLRYHGLVTGHADGGPPRIQVVTPAGRVRDVALGRKELLRIIQQAASALEVLERRQA